jgi:ankyrin repeat protein
VIAVLEKHRARAAADYGDDAVYRNLVAESLEAVSMARSPMQWWLRDETQNHISYMGMINFEDCSLLSLQRCFESFLRMRYTRAETAEERRAAAVELCKTRKLMCADIHEKDDNGEWPLTALVAKEGSAYDVGLLIAAGADVGALDDGKAPLHIACQFGYASVVEALLAQGADVNQATTDDDGRTPLCIASQNGHTSVVEMLINWGANVNQATKEDDKTPLYFAIKAGHTRIVEALLARDADVNNPATKHARFMPLNVACSEGNAGIVEALLARRADVNATCNHSGCDYCRWPLFTASYGSGGCTDSTGYASIVEMLLARGADVNRQVQGNNPLYRGETSLFAAVCSDNFSVVETLLAQGADVNLANELGETPLWRAVLFANSRRFVEVLIAGGADVNKAVVHQEPTRPSDCDCWRNFGDFFFGSTPIFNALRRHDAISLRALLAAGADVTKKLTSLPNRGASPLWVAAFEGHSECLQLLLAAGCDVNACTDDGRSPVDVATANGHSDVVQQLLLAGALQPSSAAS